MQSVTTRPLSGPRQRTDVQHPRRLAQFAMLAIVGLVFLNASAWLLPIVSEFSVIGDNMSELVLGRLGFVQTAAFLVTGFGILVLAFAIRKLTEGTWGSRVGSLLVALYGAGAIIVAIFPTERIDSASEVWSQGAAGTIHVVVALISFVCVIPGMFILFRTFLLDGRWRSRTHWWLAMFPSAALALFFAQSEGPWVGLMQRLLVGVISTWLVLVALSIRSIVAAEEARCEPARV